jgi:hypothetical protein
LYRPFFARIFPVSSQSIIEKNLDSKKKSVISGRLVRPLIHSCLLFLGAGALGNWYIGDAEVQKAISVATNRPASGANNVQFDVHCL